jgi:hypothetical protein
MSWLVLAGSLLPGMLVGYVAHEVAHWVVLRAGGWDDGLSLWPPRAGFAAPEPLPVGVRIAAVAPALLGGSVALLAVVTAPGFGIVWWGACVGACSRLFYLSAADRAVARGQVPDAADLPDRAD